MSIEKAKALCRKYATATEYYDLILEGQWRKMPPLIQKFVNDIAAEILAELEEVNQ